MLKLYKDESSILSTSIKKDQGNPGLFLWRWKIVNRALALYSCKWTRGPRAIACGARARDFRFKGTLELGASFCKLAHKRRGYLGRKDQLLPCNEWHEGLRAESSIL